MHKRLKCLKIPSKKWNKTNFGDIDKNLKVVELQIDSLDRLGYSRPLSKTELGYLVKLQGKGKCGE